MTPGKSVGRCGDAQGHGMGRHVEAVCQQRHGTGDVTGGDFANHHHEGQRHHPQRAAGVFIVGSAKEHVIVGET